MPPSLRQRLGCAFFVAVAMIFYELGRSSSLLLSVSVCDNMEEGAHTVWNTVPYSSSIVATRSDHHSLLSPSSFLDPWESNTVVITISFGKAPETKLLERLVYSIWINGKWTNGPVFVLTDQAEAYRERFAQMTATFFAPQVQQQLMSKLIILQAKPEHLHPIDPKTGQPIQFVNDAMRFKRFKTLVFDYLDEYYVDYQYGPPISMESTSSSPTPPAVAPVPYQNVLYLDVEIVVARPLVSLFQDYQDQMMEREVFFGPTAHHQNNATNQHPPLLLPVAAFAPAAGAGAFMSLFADCPQCVRPKFNLNGGVLLLHSETSRPCLDEWQSLFNLGATYGKTDQRYLLVMKQDYEQRHHHQKETHNDIINDKQQQQQQRQQQDGATNLNATKQYCKLWQLPDHHRLYPTRKEMLKKQSATIVHNTNTFRARIIPANVQRDYFQYLLLSSYPKTMMNDDAGAGVSSNGSTSFYFDGEEVETF